MKDILKRAYVKAKKSETGFDNYISALEKESYTKMLEELRKTMMNESTAVLAAMANSFSAICGSMERSNPTIPPTKPLMITSRANCGSRLLGYLVRTVQSKFSRHAKNGE